MPHDEKRRPPAVRSLALLVSVIKICGISGAFVSKSTLSSLFQWQSCSCPDASPSMPYVCSRLAQLKSSNRSNPNDDETPEERRSRMDLVRELQKSFYLDSDGVRPPEPGETTVRSLPLWRVQWSELPGFQNVLNVHVPHYTNMFLKIVRAPGPWYFGHLFLPGGSENMDNPDYRLEEGSDAALIGTLMQVSDYEQLDDGRLLVVVQALERFEVLEAERSGSPHGIATVEIMPDEELTESHYDDAIVGRTALDSLKTTSNWTEDDFRAAARAAAVAESLSFHPFEFRAVSSAEVVGGAGGISPLANFDGMVNPGVPAAAHAAAEAVKGCLTKGTSAGPDNGDRPARTQSIDGNCVRQLEYDLWVELDAMIRLLSKVNPVPGGQTPVPTQMLGLLPLEPPRPWPEGFMLESFAKEMGENENATVGTMSKSPFVRVDSIPGGYSELRRASRLSYAIWVLLDSLVVVSPDGSAVMEVTRQKVLEMRSATERLSVATSRLQSINRMLRRVLEQGGAR